MPRYVDTLAAAEAARVKPALIRTWATRGLLERRGRDHRNRALYALDDVYRIAAARRDRPQSVHNTATL